MSRTRRAVLPWYSFNPKKDGRDKKPWWKPDKGFKKMMRSGEREAVRQALIHDKEMPVFKKTDEWDWN